MFPLSVAWTTTLGASLSTVPAFDNSRAFLALRTTGETRAQVVAVSLVDGSKIWSRDIGDTQSVVAGDGLVFAVRAASPGVEAGTDARNPGKQRNLAEAGSHASEAVSGEVEASAVVNAEIDALDAVDGRPRWQYHLEAPESAPLFHVNGWLLAATEGNQLVALRARDGSKVWQVGLPAPVVATPAVSGHALYVPVAGKRVLRLELETGATMWQATLNAEPSTILALEDSVFVGTRNRSFYSLDPRNGHTRWRVRAGAEVVAGPVVTDSDVYFVSLANMIRAFDRGGGSLRAQHVLTRRAFFGPFDVGTVMLVSGRSMLIEGYTVGRLDPAGSFDAPPDLAGRVVVGPIHLVRGVTEKDLLIVTTTGEGEVVGLRPEDLVPR